jgi:dTDP-4-amino-4,6-dideoxygalactose transaminase
MLIAQADPGASYRALKSEIDAAIGRALSSGSYILGAEGRAFEAEFAAWLGTTATVGCGNGTDAVVLALRAKEIGPGSSVVTASHTAVATVAAIEMTGATALLIDVDPSFYTIDPRELAVVLEHTPAGIPPIRAVIAVHLYGQAADLDTLANICRTNGVVLIEDCAQAHGATWRGRRLGTIGDLGTYSFYPTKNLGAFGDGGAIATRDADRAVQLAALRQYGWRRGNVSDEPGVNSRLDELQAAILRVKLGHLDASNARRQAIAAAYDAALSGTSLRAPGRRADADHVFNLYVVRTMQRDAKRERLLELGVATGIHYPVPVHLQPAYRGRLALGPSGCRESEIVSQEILSLPMFAELTDTQVEQVCTALRTL